MPAGKERSMEEQMAFSRTEQLLGRAAMERLRDARVALFGVGGVGGYAAEGLVRSGVGHFALFDPDVVSISNLNRQIIATTDTIGRPKVDVMAERMRSISPEVQIEVHKVFYLPENAGQYDLSGYDFIIDAVDTVAAKIEIICRAMAAGVPIISAMGAGNKLDASGFMVEDLAKTEVCPLARVMRRELRARGILHLPVVYSREVPVRTGQSLGSTAFAPAAAGMVLASYVVRRLCGLRTGLQTSNDKNSGV